MKKIKLFTFYRENELESKWWHRFIKVLIYGSTIVVFAFSIVWFIDNISTWNNPDPKYIYSFEPKYDEMYGFSKSCTFTPDNSEDYLSINCGNISEKWSGGRYGFLPDFLDRYSRAHFYEEEFLIKTTQNQQSGGSSGFNFQPLGFDGKPINNKFFNGVKLTINYELFNQKIKDGSFDYIEAKRIIVMGPLIRNIFFIFIAPFVWFLVFKEVIYRVFIYVILGRKN